MLCFLGLCSNAVMPIAIYFACAICACTIWLWPSQAIMATIGAAAMLWVRIATAGRSGAAGSKLIMLAGKAARQEVAVIIQDRGQLGGQGQRSDPDCAEAIGCGRLHNLPGTSSSDCLLLSSC